jgi:hypothetical protein
MPYNPGMGGAGAAIGGAVGNIFAPWGNPADAGMGYLDELKRQLPGYYEDYINRGGRMGNAAEGQYNQLMNDPGGRLNQIGGGYQQSPGFQASLKNALSSANASAAAGGMAGSPMAQYHSMQTATDLSNQDYDKWMQNALGLYTGGLNGAQNMYGIGANASNSMANNMSQLAGTQAQLAYEGQNAQNQHNGGMWGNLFGGAGSLLGFL